jgi:hypothetical protein
LGNSSIKNSAAIPTTRTTSASIAKAVRENVCCIPASYHHNQQ